MGDLLNMKGKATSIFYGLDNVGKIVYKLKYHHNRSYLDQISYLIDELDGESALMIKYDHGRTYAELINILKEYPEFTYLPRMRSKAIIIYNKYSDTALDIVRNIVANRSWENFTR